MYSVRPYHQGTKSAGPSRIRRRERRDAARAATAASKSTENVEETVYDTSKEGGMTEKAMAAEEEMNAE